MIDWNDIEFFTEAEFTCRCGCGRADMHEPFVRTLDTMRRELGFGLPISSGFRCDTYNETIGGGIPHPTGRAADIPIYGERAFLLIGAAYRHNIQGIGQKQHGDHAGRYVHLDVVDPSLLADPSAIARPWPWTYS